MDKCFIGIDVGTGSARAGVFDSAGRKLAAASRPIRIWRPAPLHAEQSGDDIWQAVCAATRDAMAQAAVPPESVAGIGFDATCSLVLTDAEGQPVAVNGEGEDARNIILWMDQRATPEAAEINAGGYKVLDYVGGRISPEMETPKLLWLSRHLPESFARIAHAFDLADFLTWKATGSLTRSTCTTTCKWTYLAHERRWEQSYFEDLGLGALAENGFARIGATIAAPGVPAGQGLTGQAAVELGLPEGTAVGTGMIDAHAGAIGTLGAGGLAGDLTTRLAYVFGTSACTLNITKDPAFVPGVWGPYFDALLPDFWLNEGGQSAAGAAIDHLVQLHPHSPEARAAAEVQGQGLTAWLEQKASAYLQVRSATEVVKGLHIVPEFLGNRAPYADPDARAVIAGLSLDSSEDSLVQLYIAGVMSIGYGLRQILDALAGRSVRIETVVISGGAARSALVRQLLADAADIPIATVNTDEPVLLGAAMLGALAAGAAADLPDAMARMSSCDDLVRPDPALQTAHAQRRETLARLQAVYRDLRDH